jgi:hypothetical protein
MSSQSKKYGVQEVQFVGQAVKQKEATQWVVTWALLSNSMAVSTQEEMCKRIECVRAFMHCHGLVHMGWLRIVSHGGPVNMSDIRKQKVCDRVACALHDLVL